VPRNIFDFGSSSPVAEGDSIMYPFFSHFRGKFVGVLFLFIFLPFVFRKHGFFDHGASKWVIFAISLIFF